MSNPLQSAHNPPTEGRKRKPNESVENESHKRQQLTSLDSAETIHSTSGGKYVKANHWLSRSSLHGRQEQLEDTLLQMKSDFHETSTSLTSKIKDLETKQTATAAVGFNFHEMIEEGLPNMGEPQKMWLFWKLCKAVNFEDVKRALRTHPTLLAGQKANKEESEAEDDKTVTGDDEKSPERMFGSNVQAGDADDDELGSQVSLPRD